MRVGNGEEQRQREKGDPEPDRKLREDVGRLRAENVFRDSAAESRPETFTAGQLHEDNQHQQQAHKDMQGEENG